MARHRKPITWHSIALKMLNRAIIALLSLQGKLIMMKGSKNGINS